MGEKKERLFLEKRLQTVRAEDHKKSPSKKKDALTLRESINERAIMRLKSMREMELTREVNFS